MILNRIWIEDAEFFIYLFILALYLQAGFFGVLRHFLLILYWPGPML